MISRIHYSVIPNDNYLRQIYDYCTQTYSTYPPLSEPSFPLSPPSPPPSPSYNQSSVSLMYTGFEIQQLRISNSQVCHLFCHWFIVFGTYLGHWNYGELQLLQTLWGHHKFTTFLFVQCHPIIVPLPIMPRYGTISPLLCTKILNSTHGPY